MITISCTEDELAPYQLSDLDFGPAIELRPIWTEGAAINTQAFQLVITAQPEEDRLHPAVVRGMIVITAVKAEVIDGPINLVVQLTPPVPLPPQN